MPRVILGVFKALLVLSFSIALASAVATVLPWIKYATSTIDDASMSLTGLPARDETVSSQLREAFTALATISPFAAIAVMIVYFIHRSKR